MEKFPLHLKYMHIRAGALFERRTAALILQKAMHGCCMNLVKMCLPFSCENLEGRNCQFLKKSSLNEHEDSSSTCDFGRRRRRGSLNANVQKNPRLIVTNLILAAAEVCVSVFTVSNNSFPTLPIARFSD